jgi:uncharacterized protein
MGFLFQAWRVAVSGAAVAAAAFLFTAPAGAANTTLDLVNHGVVELEVGSADGSSARLAEDIANLVDDGTTRRVVTVLGEGSLQNLEDLKALRGIDLAFVQSDVLDYARTQKLISGIETITYVAKLTNEEFHLLARRDIKSIDQLAGQKVNFDIQGGGSGVTAARIFAALGITVQPTNDPTMLALAKLEKGDIAAVAFVGAKPAPAFRDLDPSTGLHFVSIPANAAITQAYAPTRLTAKDYPGLIGSGDEIDTAAVGTVLVAANLVPESERYQNLVNFVDAFFTQFSTLLEPGHQPGWRDVNLAAEVPGMKRFRPAEVWLAQHAPVAKAQPQDIRAMFERFLNERLSASGANMTQQQKDDLFTQFQRWQSGQTH